MRPPKTLIEHAMELLPELEKIKSKPGYDELEQLVLLLETCSLGIQCPASAKEQLKKIAWREKLSFNGIPIQDVFEVGRIRKRLNELV